MLFFGESCCRALESLFLTVVSNKPRWKKFVMFLKKTWHAKTSFTDVIKGFAGGATLGFQTVVRLQVSFVRSRDLEDNHVPKHKSAPMLQTAAGEPLARCKNPQIVLLQRIKWVVASLEAPTSRYSLENWSKFYCFQMLTWGCCDLIYMPRQGTTCWLLEPSGENALHEIIYCFYSFIYLFFNVRLIQPASSNENLCWSACLAHQITSYI